MDKLFIETLMAYIMEATMIPKSQIERVVGPVLSMFLDVVLTETFRENQNFSGSIVMVSPEFPLKKKDNWQSTNIDWLMYNIDRKQLLFVELKTSDTSINDNQNSIYHNMQEAILSKGGAFLIEDLVQMRDRSSEFGKYQYILETKVLPLKDEISNCQDARIIYLVPKSAEHKVKGHADSILTFGMLSKSIPGKFSEEWGIIRDHLCALDISSQRSRNLQYRISNHLRVIKKIATADVEINPNTRISASWQGTLNFHEMFNLCLKHEDSIIVGFTGGIQAFTRSTFSKLLSRRFRWDYAKNMIGKMKVNWLSGSTVIELLSQHHGYPYNQGTSTDVEINPITKKSLHWQGTVNFQEMFSLCVERGDNIIVGFKGGTERFSRSTFTEIQGRRFFRWDYAKNMMSKKKADWLSGSTIIEILRQHHGYPTTM